jgi:plasmid stabilization system protein ParE
VPQVELEVSIRARADLEEIEFFTELEWGVEQAKRYTGSLKKSVDLLLRFPEMGVETAIGGLEFRTFVTGEHKLHYQLIDNVLRLLRVEGPGQDLSIDEIANTEI